MSTPSPDHAHHGLPATSNPWPSLAPSSPPAATWRAQAAPSMPHEMPAYQVEAAEPGPAPQAPVQPSWSATNTAPQLTIAAPIAYTRDPSRTALAAVITFIVALVGLWAIFAYLGKMSDTLASIVDGNQKMIAQLSESNQGLEGLERKTAYVGVMNQDAAELQRLMAGLDSDMGKMLTSVGSIGTEMDSMGRSLGQLDQGLDAANSSSTSIGSKLGTINQGLQSEAEKVRTMRGDVAGSASSLVLLPAALRATNSRLAYINRNVRFMGVNGISNAARLRLSLLGIPNGTAELSGVIIPPGAWS